MAGFRFLEKEEEPKPYYKRKYSKQFSVSSVRFIDWELKLDFPKTDRDISLNTEKVWYRSNGSEFTRRYGTIEIGKNWDNCRTTGGIGLEDPDHWKPGTYSADLKIEGEKIASGSFEVVE